MLNGGSMIWGFCVYFVYMIPLETDVLRKHRFQKCCYSTQHEGLNGEMGDAGEGGGWKYHETVTLSLLETFFVIC